MSRHDRTPGSGSDRTNLYDEITGKIIAELEAGRFPWAQPWGKATAGAPLGLPQNASTRRAYSGINILILWGSVVQHGFPGQGWLTYRQAAALGGNVREGERGTTVVYADRFVPEDEKQRARETGEVLSKRGPAWTIYNPTTNAVAGLVSTSRTAPTLPSGDTAKALLPGAHRFHPHAGR